MFCQYGPTEDPDEDPGLVGEIHRLYVDPSHQNRGGGRLLVASACDAFRLAGDRSATLWALEQDARARSFYERLGWRDDGARADPDVRYRIQLT